MTGLEPEGGFIVWKSGKARLDPLIPSGKCLAAEIVLHCIEIIEEFENRPQEGQKEYAMKLIKTILLILFICTAVPAFATEWVPIEGTDRYFDRSRIRTESNGNILIWQKTVLKDYLVRKLEADLRRMGNSIDYTGYSYSIELWEINCKQQTHGIRSIINYTEDGRIIDSFDMENVHLRPVPPESEGEAAFRAACAHMAKKNKGNENE